MEKDDYMMMFGEFKGSLSHILNRLQSGADRMERIENEQNEKWDALQRDRCTPCWNRVAKIENSIVRDKVLISIGSSAVTLLVAKFVSLLF